MKNDSLEGKWKEVKGKFKQKYGELTHSDLTYSDGKFDEMLGRLQQKTGKATQELKEEIGKNNVFLDRRDGPHVPVRRLLLNNFYDDRTVYL